MDPSAPITLEQFLSRIASLWNDGKNDEEVSQALAGAKIRGSGRVVKIWQASEYVEQPCFEVEISPISIRTNSGKSDTIEVVPLSVAANDDSWRDVAVGDDIVFETELAVANSYRPSIRWCDYIGDGQVDFDTKNTRCLRRLAVSASIAADLQGLPSRVEARKPRIMDRQLSTECIDISGSPTAENVAAIWPAISDRLHALDSHVLEMQVDPLYGMIYVYECVEHNDEYKILSVACFYVVELEIAYHEDVILATAEGGGDTVEPRHETFLNGLFEILRESLLLFESKLGKAGREEIGKWEVRVGQAADRPEFEKIWPMERRGH